ncbi:MULTISPECIES: radical SAM family heme chaperone HemW [unclassified Leptotrichia]|uniref:radical SAM family heme chaperone HemW n=1 Tax=unclassified Leptotrichia TaxID=2633022 RepID=UPI0003ADD8A3|nr:MULTISPECIES: radical SAM family heme chaperone HemW [unclassified Leptotrichia]ERL27024.1 putative oxygen-independent coproporphyrinogen III oxidase [Leptotrichia sp. oral taxon 225 str. F0581]WLD74264.1 radical SAM family heme chaperone HemW [Leptotrichia sp. HMT-225]
MIEIKEKDVDAIYIHIPFCDKKCEYCDFCTFVRMEKEYRKYVDYLIREIRMYPKFKYDTIYFGGGTPSVLPVGMIKEIMDELNWTGNAEITLELNPTDMTLEKLKEIREIGINRLSIGIQSFQNHVLNFIGRQHSSDDAVNVYKMARKAGFNNITVDLMFGIPNQSIEDLQKDLNILKELKPENVSIYSLIWEEGTVFWSKLQKGILSEIDQDVEAQMYEMIIEFFNENGYCHYEISNFARIDENFEENRNINKNCNLEKRIDFQNFSEIKNNEETLKNEIFKNIETFEMIKERQKNGGRHNLKYWRNMKFIGVGMSAAAYYGENRHSNVRTFNKYYKFLDNKELPIDENTIEIVDKIEREKLSRMLGLRLIQEGIEYFEDERVEKLIKNGLLEKFIVKKVDFSEKREQKIEKFIDTKEKEIKNKVKNNESFNEKTAEKTYEIRLRLTKRGMLLANDVFVEFI